MAVSSKFVSWSLVAVALGIAAGPVSACKVTDASNGGPCSKESSSCKVYCDNGQLGGTMNWNGSVWTDGVKWDPDMNAEARKICAANGSDCT